MLSSCSHALIRLALLVGLAGCHAAQPAYFNPSTTPHRAFSTAGRSAATPVVQVPASAPARSSSSALSDPIYEEALPSQPAIYQHVEVLKLRTVPTSTAPQPRHTNPDQATTRRASWLHTTQLLPETNTTYTANRLTLSDVPTKRKLPKGVVYSLAASVLPYGMLLLTHLPAWAWVLSLTLPLAAMLLAAGALTKIRRNKAQFHGRGWAALALILATGYVGMTLAALAALATSGILWE